MPTPLRLMPGLMCDHSVWSPLLPLLPHQHVQIADHGDSNSLVDMANRLLKTAPPLFDITGEHDGWADVAQHRAMADLLPAKTEVCVIANAGHMLTMEEPTAVAQVFLNWLN